MRPMKRYALREAVPESVRTALREYPELVQTLLYYRGVADPETAAWFLEPEYAAHTHDPFRIADMQRAVERICTALDAGETIAIYSDYDADGVPGAAILHDLFARIEYPNVVHYIPHRDTEGYGVHPEAVEQLAADGVTLIITVDCGISAHEAVARASELGVEVIVTDHHEPNGALPDAHAVLDVKRDDDTYPYQHLTGAAIAFKLVQALVAHREFGLPEGWEKWLLDMVGIATIADMVPLTGENRVLATYGLLVLRKSPRPGLQQLLRAVGATQTELTEDDVGFLIAPRINAASRMDAPWEAFRLLATQDAVEAGERARHLHRINDTRKGVVASMVKEIRSRLERRETLNDVIVMGNPQWRPALLGLAANSIAEELERPVFLWGREASEVLKGSCRGAGVNVLELMNTASDAFIEFGGHQASAGFSLTQEAVYTLEDRLSTALAQLPHEAAAEATYVDADLTLGDVRWETYRHVHALAPFGMENPKPVFRFNTVQVQQVRTFGKEGNHLHITFTDERNARASAVAFFARPESFQRTLVQGEWGTLIATMERSVFRGKIELRLRPVDFV